MKIKTTKQLNLPQLIEWAWDNNVKNERYRCSDSNPYEYVWINENYDVELDEDMRISKNDTFTVEVEEEITEDTEFKSMVEVTTDDLFAVWEQASISTWESEHSKEFHAYIDGEFKLIWRDGKLVE